MPGDKANRFFPPTLRGLFGFGIRGGFEGEEISR